MKRTTTTKTTRTFDDSGNLVEEVTTTTTQDDVTQAEDNVYRKPWIDPIRPYWQYAKDTLRQSWR